MEEKREDFCRNKSRSPYLKIESQLHFNSPPIRTNYLSCCPPNTKIGMEIAGAYMSNMKIINTAMFISLG